MTAAIEEGAVTLGHPLTHNGTWTVTNLGTGDHRTYRIRTQKDDADFMPGKRLFGVLRGPSNEWDYTTLGIFNDDGTVTLWRKYRGTEWERHARAFTALVVEGQYPDRVRVDASTVCRVCNRKLTTPESIAAGIGPVCAEGGAR